MTGIFSPRAKTARPLQEVGTRNSSVVKTGILGPRHRSGSLGEVVSTIANYTAIGGVVSTVANYAPIGLGRALGAASTIPAACWDAAGFDDCHAKWFAQAQTDCQNGDAAANFGGDMDTCTDTYADSYSLDNCVPTLCPGTLPTVQSGGLTASQVQAIQQTCNSILSANGYKTIAVDGKLGPATCGAALYLQQSNLSTVYSDNNLSAYCTTWTNPTQVGASAPMQTTVMPTIDANVPYTQPVWGQSDPSIPAAQAQINASLVASGYNPIPLTGVLDAATCGAMQWMRANMGQDLLSTTGANCQAYTLPTPIAPGLLPPGQTSPGSPPPTNVPAGPTPPSTHPITSATMLAGGLALAAVGGLYYLAKKKGLV